MCDDRLFVDEDWPLAAPAFAPRPPAVMPIFDIKSGPLLCMTFNFAWLPHLLGALAVLDQPDAWTNDAAATARNQIRTLMASVSEYCMLPLGTIVPFAGRIADLPEFTLPCDGSLHLRADYPDLYDALYGAFIVDDTTFRVPDTRGRALIGEGSGRLTGDSGGSVTHTLTLAEMPPHEHTYQSASPVIINGGIEAPANAAIPLSAPTATTGGGQPHNNMPPYLVVQHYIIAKEP